LELHHPRCDWFAVTLRFLEYTRAASTGADSSRSAWCGGRPEASIHPIVWSAPFIPTAAHRTAVGRCPAPGLLHPARSFLLLVLFRPGGGLLFGRFLGGSCRLFRFLCLLTALANARGIQNRAAHIGAAVGGRGAFLVRLLAWQAVLFVFCHHPLAARSAKRMQIEKNFEAATTQY